MMNDQRASLSQVLPRQSLFIAAFSTVVEWYDFTLYLYFATVLSRVFFGSGTQSLLTTLGGFAIAYLMRPFGAIVFGHVGDRLGRRHMLLISVAMMTAAMLATALLPTRAQVGPAAGWLLLLLRCGARAAGSRKMRRAPARPRTGSWRVARIGSFPSPP